MPAQKSPSQNRKRSKLRVEKAAVFLNIRVFPQPVRHIRLGALSMNCKPTRRSQISPFHVEHFVHTIRELAGAPPFATRFATFCSTSGSTSLCTGWLSCVLGRVSRE